MTRGIACPAVLDLPRIRCSPFHTEQHADPIGSAPAYDAFLVVDVALPWESEATGQEPIRSMVDAARVAGDVGGPRWRMLARVPTAAHLADGRRRVSEHRATRRVVDGRELRGPFSRREWIVDERDVVALGRDLLGGRGDPRPDARSDPLVTSDLLVCTHGRRDQCCGSFGTAFVEHLGDVLAASGAEVDCQRISHTGGHRFAPTAIAFPDGYAWAHLDEPLADLLVRRARPVAQFAAHCRGSALFAGGPAQAADRAGLVEVGWAWADAARAVDVVGFDRTTMATTLQVTGVLVDGEVHRFDVVVVVDRQIPMPTCGIVDGPEYRTETVWRVDDVVRVDGADPAGQ